MLSRLLVPTQRIERILAAGDPSSRPSPASILYYDLAETYLPTIFESTYTLLAHLDAMAGQPSPAYHMTLEGEGPDETDSAGGSLFRTTRLFGGHFVEATNYDPQPPICSISRLRSANSEGGETQLIIERPIPHVPGVYHSVSLLYSVEEQRKDGRNEPTSWSERLELTIPYPLNNTHTAVSYERSSGRDTPRIAGITPRRLPRSQALNDAKNLLQWTQTVLTAMNGDLEMLRGLQTENWLIGA